MLSDQDVQHIAELARIELTGQEHERFKKELSSVLEYIAKLDEVSVQKAAPLYQTTGLTNALRADEHRDDFPMTDKLNELLVGQAPHRQERFIKARSVKKK